MLRMNPLQLILNTVWYNETLIDVIIIQNGDTRKIYSENRRNIMSSFWYIKISFQIRSGEKF